ncbi:hypothetical protein ABPG72_021467 [Tetrahymena utriculariae]
MRLNTWFVLYFVVFLITVNGQSIPIFMANQAAVEDYNNCIKSAIALNSSPCSASSNVISCINLLSDYASCIQNCIQKPIFKDFQKCNTDCGNTAIAADSSLTTYLNSLNACIAKLDVPASPSTITIPPFITDQQAAKKYTECLWNFLSQNLNPCSTGPNPQQCQSILNTYFSCQTLCYLKKNFSEFQSCNNDCGNTAATSDSTLNSYIKEINGCVSKMNISLILISTLSPLLLILLI